MPRFVGPLSVALLATAAPLHAQAVPLKEMDWIVGRWTGRGTMTFGPSQQHEATVVETATLHAGGHVLVLQGLGKTKVEGKADEMVVHDAFATIWRDSTGYRMRAFRANGHAVEPEIKVTDGRIVWGFDDPRAGQVRFTVVRTPEGRWHEIGEMSRDGTAWVKFFEMMLVRD